MPNRRVLNSWKEIAAYLSRGVRTVQRWELLYRLPVRRANPEGRSVFAFADEIDAFMERAKPKSIPYVRPTFIVLEAVTPNALSDLKLSLEGAKFNVLTAYTAAEVIATAAKYDVDGFVVDAIILDVHPSELGQELRRLYPFKPRLLIGDGPDAIFEAQFSPGDHGAVIRWLIERFDEPFLAQMSNSNDTGNQQ